jgi:hypothetical protein
MRSRSVRWTLVVVAWIAIGAAGYFLFSSQKKIAADAASLRAVDLHAREADDAIADLRVGQQAYVATGQGVAFWMPKVAATAEAATVAIGAARQSATAAEARASMEQAAGSLTEFIEVDKRARDYIHAGQTLMAGDVIYTEGAQLAAAAARQLEAGRLAERQAFDAAEAAMRRQQAIALGSLAAALAFFTLLLGATGADTAAEPVEDSRPPARPELTLSSLDDGIVSHARPAAAAPPPPAAAAPLPPATASRNAIVLKATAALATDFGRVRDSDELARLLSRTADLIDAKGLVVWMAMPAGDGEVLRPVLAHGYAPNLLARMPAVPKAADNAAAAAYRTGALQIVLSKPGGGTGAVVAPILGAAGCLGSLSAEIAGGGEGSDAVQAVTTIVAAHLAGVLGAAPEEPAASETPKAAAQG